MDGRVAWSDPGTNLGAAWVLSRRLRTRRRALDLSRSPTPWAGQKAAPPLLVESLAYLCFPHVLRRSWRRLLSPASDPRTTADPHNPPPPIGSLPAMSSPIASTSALPVELDLATSTNGPLPGRDGDETGKEVRLKGFAAGTASGLTKLVVGREYLNPWISLPFPRWACKGVPKELTPSLWRLPAQIRSTRSSSVCNAHLQTPTEVR